MVYGPIPKSMGAVSNGAFGIYDLARSHGPATSASILHSRDWIFRHLSGSPTPRSRCSLEV